MRLIATAAGTEGRLTVFEQVTPSGWGPPRHIHSREDEIVYILDGTYEISLGDERRTVSAGACAVLPRGFRNILANNSGVYELGPIESITEDQFHRMFNVNVLGLLLITQEAVKHMREGGSIINIGSGVTRTTPPGSAIYTGTKGAVNAITECSQRNSGRERFV